MRQLRLPLILLLLSLLVACGQTDEPAATEEASAQPTEAVAAAPTEAEAPTSKPPTPTLVPEPTPTEMPAPTVAPTEVPPPTETPVAMASSCVSCHKDEQLLIDTASPIEEEESGESSGVG